MTTGFEFGLERFFAEFRTKARVGLVTNASGCDRHGRHTAERLVEHPGIELRVIFSPEHGFGANEPDGESVGDSQHGKLHVPIVSLYGPKKSPSPEDFAGLDLLIYDIQDVGVRFYTYISTLRNIMAAASRQGLPVHVFDRPDLLGGEIVEGPHLHEGFNSFVGHLPIPLRYGLTPGELARWLKRWLALPGDLVVWKCAGWYRGMSFEECQIPWRNLSPSMVSAATARFYPGTCLFEGTNVSEGRGTSAPFQILGAPWVNAEVWRDEVLSLVPDHVQVEKQSFVPTFSKFTGEECQGIKLSSAAEILENSVLIGLMSLEALMRTHPGMIEFTAGRGLPHPFFDHLAGNARVREGLIAGMTAREVYEREMAGISSFRAECQTEVHLYDPLPRST
jgi:uncharacterized protein YbbC (DUF1343 family)